MMGGANPDGVDGEVGNYWRTLYKLEKNFDSVPTAKRIAGKVTLHKLCTFLLRCVMLIF